MGSTGSSRWSRRFVAASASYLVLWRAGALFGVPRRTEVLLAVLGFVCHVVFGMAYLLIPSYFGRVLATDRGPAAHLGLSVFGAAALAVASGRGGALETLGAVAWSLGVAIFLGTLLWTIRDNLTGRETGTSAARAEHRRVDRYANPFVLVAFGYLAVGSYETLARISSLPGLTDGYFPRITHLLAAGFAALLLFSLGVRLAPRFLGVPAPKPLVAVVLPAGSLGPALIALGLGGGFAFRVGAILEAGAVVGFAVLIALLFARSDRRRIGFYGVLGGVLSGVAGVSLGLSFAFGWDAVGLRYAHLQLNLLGFLGLAIAGFAVQFFPPEAGRFRGASDRTAILVIAALAAGLALIVTGAVGTTPWLVGLGNGIALAGAIGYWYLVGRLMIAIGKRHAGA